MEAKIVIIETQAKSPDIVKRIFGCEISTVNVCVDTMWKDFHPEVTDEIY